MFDQRTKSSTSFFWNSSLDAGQERETAHMVEIHTDGTVTITAGEGVRVDYRPFPVGQAGRSSWTV